MPTIRLDDDVFNGLKSLAEPFTDTPNSVIRRLLQERGAIPKDGNSAPPAEPTPTLTSERKTIGKPRVAGLVSQATYEKYLLHVLATQFKGRGDKQEVTRAVIKLLESRGLVGNADRVHVSSGETRAENTIAWGRNALKERGLISQASPRGTWELTERGMKEGRESAL
ncbi:MAG TPA: winged helix-turn-helix domain-containing protein [Steroidobacteraceae bacterium]|nr:winged helix-turn-helix domain-containing protein [Steroidobacteraceae bacterium]